jgi:hypothetical protein
MEKTLYAGFWESLRVMALFLQQSSFLDRLWVFTFASSLRLFFPMQPPRVHPILSPLSHTTPLRCPAFSSSPRSPSRGHVVESTEGPNTQTQQGLTSTSTACLQMEMEDRRAGHRGGWGGQDAANQLNFSKRNESADNAPEACARRYAIVDAMAAWESLLVA